MSRRHVRAMCDLGPRVSCKSVHKHLTFHCCLVVLQGSSEMLHFEVFLLIILYKIILLMMMKKKTQDIHNVNVRRQITLITIVSN